MEWVYGREDGCLSLIHNQGKKVSKVDEDASNAQEMQCC